MSTMQGGPRFNPDALAFINAANLVNNTHQNAINRLVLDLKNYGIWTKMKAIYPFVGGTASSHKFNLKDPRDLDAAFRLTFTAGWIHSSNGALPNGTSDYAETNLNSFNSLSVNNTHTSLYVINDPTPISSSPGFGNRTNATTSFYTHLKLSNTYYSFIGIEGSTPYGNSYNNTDSKGFYITSRTSSINLKSYKNNLLQNTTILQNTGNLPSLTYTYGGIRNGVSTINSVTWNNYLHSFASIGDGLTDTEAANLYTAVQAYQTSLNRQV